MREQVLEDYRKMTLEDLLKARFYGSYVSGPIEQIILEKVKELEESCRMTPVNRQA